MELPSSFLAPKMCFDGAPLRSISEFPTVSFCLSNVKQGMKSSPDIWRVVIRERSIHQCHSAGLEKGQSAGISEAFGPTMLQDAG